MPSRLGDEGVLGRHCRLDQLVANSWSGQMGLCSTLMTIQEKTGERWDHCAQWGCSGTSTAFNIMSPMSRASDGVLVDPTWSSQLVRWTGPDGPTGSFAFKFVPADREFLKRKDVFQTYLADLSVSYNSLAVHSSLLARTEKERARHDPREAHGTESTSQQVISSDTKRS